MRLLLLNPPHPAIGSRIPVEHLPPLGLLSLGVAIESVRRFIEPVSVHYAEALFIAVIGLAVNVASAFLLHDPHEPDDHHRDHNLRAAYVHVLARW